MVRLICLSLLISVAACSPRPLRTQLASTDAEGGNADKDSGDATGDGNSEPEDEGSEGEDIGEDAGDQPADEKEDPGSTDKEPEKEKEPEQPKVDPKTFAASLDNFRWEFKCDRDVGGDQECDSPDATDTNKTFAGDSAKTYSVELQFRGVVEPMMYKDGKLEGERFYIGGTTNNGTYNIYAIEVSEPKQVYYLNSNPSVGHDVFVLDYKAKIKVKGGAKIHLLGNGQNLRMIANYKKLEVPGLDQSGKPFNGQYIQMNVVGVTEE